MMRQRKILGTQLIMALVAIIIGFKLKIEHSEYASIVILLGFGAVLVLYPFRFANKKQKQLIDYMRLITIMLCGINGLALGSRFLRKSVFEEYALMGLKVTVVIWIIAELVHLVRGK